MFVVRSSPNTIFADASAAFARCVFRWRSNECNSDGIPSSCATGAQRVFQLVNSSRRLDLFDAFAEQAPVERSAREQHFFQGSVHRPLREDSST